MEKRGFTKFVSVLGNLANNRYLTAVRNGMSIIIPIVIIGSVFTIVLNFPSDAWKAFIAPFSSKLQIVSSFTMDFMSIYVCIGIASSLCDDYGLDKVSTSALSVLAFLILELLHLHQLVQKLLKQQA